MLSEDEQRAFDDIATRFGPTPHPRPHSSRARWYFIVGLLGVVGTTSTFTFSIPLALFFVALSYFSFLCSWNILKASRSQNHSSLHDLAQHSRDHL